MRRSAVVVLTVVASLALAAPAYATGIRSGSVTDVRDMARQPNDRQADVQRVEASYDGDAGRIKVGLSFHDRWYCIDPFLCDGGPYGDFRIVLGAKLRANGDCMTERRGDAVVEGSFAGDAEGAASHLVEGAGEMAVLIERPGDRELTFEVVDATLTRGDYRCVGAIRVSSEALEPGKPGPVDSVKDFQLRATR